MKFLSPVVWHEGMHLSQHHFQAQSRYFEDLTRFVLSCGASAPWGVLDLDLDAEALMNGTAVVVQGRGLLPDGTPFHFPHDEPPAPVAVASLFSPTSESHVLLLALAEFQADRGNCAPPGAGARYSPVSADVLDDTSGTQERPVEFAHRNFRLLLDIEPADGMVSLPIARIRRDGKGHFVFDPTYVAPTLRIGASPRLMSMLSRLVEMLDAKADAMRAERTAAGAGGGDIAGFWLSHAIHAAVAPLRHMLQTRAAHPEALHAELARLAGALCTFSLDVHPRDLPLYDHALPEAGFAALEAHIRRHLERVAPSGAVPIRLQPAVPSGEGRDEVLVVGGAAAGPATFFAGAINDTRVLGRGEWYLGVRSTTAPAQVAARAPELVKACAARFVARLVREALPGLGVEHVPVPPAELPARPGVVYFRLVRTEPCWAAIVRTAEIGVYVPAAIADADLTLDVVLAG